MNLKTRRRLSILILVVALPVYIVMTVSIINWLGRPSLFIEFLVYVGAGIAWAIPLRFVFLGVGRKEE